MITTMLQGESGTLQDLALLLLLLPGEQCGARGVLEHLSNTFVGLGGALEVFLGSNLLADVLGLESQRCQQSHVFSRLTRRGWMAYLLWCHGLLRRLVKLLNRLLVVSQILLASDEDDWEALAEM